MTSHITYSKLKNIPAAKFYCKGNVDIIEYAVSTIGVKDSSCVKDFFCGCGNGYGYYDGDGGDSMRFNGDFLFLYLEPSMKYFPWKDHYYDCFEF